MILIKQQVFGISVVFLWWLASCTVVVQANESQSYKLSDGVKDRNYRLYRPSSLSHHMPAPLVIVLHGGLGSASQAESSYNWDAQADRQGFVVVYPNGISHSWNAGGICCGPALRGNVNDIGFLTRLIDTVSRSENIDLKRVYLTGISNGAAMAYRYVCEGTFPIAAIGPVAGSFSYSCSKPHPVSVMAIHGLGDQHIPFAGGPGTKGVTKGTWMSVPQTLDLFRKANDCQPAIFYKDGLVQKNISHCAQDREVTLITIEGAGHQWPGGKSKTSIIQRVIGADQPSTALDATSTLWEFFQSHGAQP
jgi:polyhydroxybutyrate depolymerase